MICIVAAAGFFALIAYNLIAAGSVITIDGLFLILVPLVLALSFLSVPAKEFVSRRLERKALSTSAEQRQISDRGATVAGGSAPVLKDARGRPMPPDVRRIVAELQAPRATKVTSR